MKELPDIHHSFSDWYNDVIYKAELVDHSPVRGSFIIRPYGYELWEHVKDTLDKKIKLHGNKNAAFPLLIPESFLKKEAAHVEGFAPELAVVTHAGGKQLEDPLVIRPTSETIIHFMFAKWIKSWRDLPYKINQWANIVRWEMRTRPFLRTTEIFWQEGHTAHATEQEADDFAHTMLDEYADVAENWLAIPVVKGKKSELEKFPGAIATYTFEALMPDGKALQMGTSHLLSQSFAHSFDMKFQDKDGAMQYPYLTSWGTTTRLIGATVMVHGDQKGLVLPPKVAPIQVVIIPILKKGADTDKVMQAVEKLHKDCLAQGIRAELDADTQVSPGAKFYHWELRGVPIRIELGPRDLDSGKAMVASRIGEKQPFPLDTLADKLPALLTDMQKQLYDRAVARLKEQWHQAESLADFKDALDDRPGFYQVGWCQENKCEQVLKPIKASIRCLLDDSTKSVCFNCGNKSICDVLIAKSY